MVRKVFLPVTPPLPGEQIAALRKQLGGPGHQGDAVESRAGRLTVPSVVTFPVRKTRRLGVLVSFDGVSGFVYYERALIRRTMLDDLEAAAPADVDPETQQLFDRFAGFAGLAAGQRVRVVTTSESLSGTLLERCKFGGIVRVEGGRVLAVGFANLSAAGIEA